MLIRVADVYDRRSTPRLKRALGLLEPVLILTRGGRRRHHLLADECAGWV